MPGIVGFQETWVVGSRLYFKRDDEGTTTYPTIDLGTVTQTTPNFEPTIIQARDPDGGRLNLIDEAFTDINESYEVTCVNINNENLNLLMYGDGLKELKPAGSDDSNTDVRHRASIGPGKLTKLFSKSAKSGETELLPAYNVSGLTGTKVSGSQSLRLYDGTNGDTADFELVSAERGLVRFFAGGFRNLSDQDEVDLSFTEDAYANNNTRLIKPQESSSPVSGKAFIVFSRNNNTRQSVRECNVSIQVSASNFSIEDYSNITLTVSVLTDIQDTDIAGRYMLIKGAEIPDPEPGQGNIG